MSDATKSYLLPNQTIPVLNLSDHLADLLEVKQFFENRGIQTKNTRVERYVHYLENLLTAGPRREIQIFKNSQDARFVTPIDWWLYVMREVHELMWILRGLKINTPKGVDPKLEIVIGGRDFAALDQNSHSRDVQFELRIVSYFCQAGCEVDLTTETDIIAVTPRHAFYVECKRVASMPQLERRLSEAEKQLRLRMPRNHEGRPAYGCIAADVTKLAFAHNGLTFGETNEHSKNIIQDKLKLLSDSGSIPSLRNKKNILQHWLQIHIPALIRLPATAITRFSSCYVLNPQLNRNAVDAFIELDRIANISQRGDPREIRSQPLTRRTQVQLSSGTTLWVDNELLNQFLGTGTVCSNSPESIVAGVVMNGFKNEFTFAELECAVSKIDGKAKKLMERSPGHARAILICSMILHRYPFQEIPITGEPLNLTSADGHEISKGSPTIDTNLWGD